MKKFLTLLTFVLLLPLTSIYSEDPLFDPDPIKVELVNEEDTIKPGRPFWVAIKVNIQEGWHSYWKNPGDTGAATTIEWELPPGFTAGSTEWPFPQRFELNSIIGFGYEGDFWVLTPITPPQNLSADHPIEIAANINWLVCSDTNCLPGESKAKLSLSVSPQEPKTRADQATSFADSRSKMAQRQWKAEVERKESLIVLKLQAPSFTPYNKANFFPETKNLIDNQTEATWTKDETNPQQYVMSFKEKENKGKAISSLKGVLVVYSEGEKKPEVVEINVPVSGKANEAIAMADEVEKEEIPLKNPDSVATIVSSDHAFDGGVGLAIVLAFVGGLLLNLMPCVLPVVSFKILSFVKLSGQSRTITLKHGLAFSFGVILSFWVLAGLLLILQAYGRSVGWGFQLQEPIFVALLAALLFVFGLSLFGVFELGASLTGLANSSPSKTGLMGSFFSGVLATAVATPCTGPFLGTAIGFAVTLPPISSLMIFTSLGLGMSSPYLLLAAFPQLLRFLPKPGNWMVTFKELMGFLMVATAIWLVWVFGAQTNNLGVALLLSGLFFFGIGCWIMGKWGTPVQSSIVRRIAYFCVVATFSLGGFTIFTSTEPWVEAYGGSHNASDESSWEPFSEERIAELQKQGIPVFVDFTAKWCLICQANHYILTKDDVEAKFKELGVVKMKADWTKNDPAITKALRQFGRSGVPLYLLYGTTAGENPAILPQVLTTDIVIDYLDQISVKMAKQ